MRATCPVCLRVWAHISKSEPAECPTCRVGMKPLGTVGSQPREADAEKKQGRREKRPPAPGEPRA